MGLFDMFGKNKKQESAMDVFIRAVYGDPRPACSWDLIPIRKTISSS